MSQNTTSQESWLDFFPESVGVANLPSFEPTDPDSFERDFEELGLDNLDDDVYFPELSNAPLPIYRDVSTPSSLTSSSGSMHSMDLTEDGTNSEYSSMTHTTSTYQPPVAFRNVDFNPQSIGVDPKQTSTMFPDPAVLINSDTAGFFDSFKTQFPSNFFDTVQVVKAQSDEGPYRPSVGISPHCLFAAATQDASFAFPMDSPVGAALIAQSDMGPTRKKFICPECGHREYRFYSFLFILEAQCFFLVSARKHNLKTHMETHNPNRPKPFVCPEGDCGHPFTRKHDLKRHLESMHGAK